MHGRLAIVDDPLFAAHRAGESHPERPERLMAARDALATTSLSLERRTLTARDATDEELARVHDAAYVEQLGQSAGKQGFFDADTYFAPGSAAAARRAAGGVVALVDALLNGSAEYGIALVRPPGHHALPGSAMGFCLLNNVAIAAAHARAAGCDRVMIVDWDVHHGNGTQAMFYDDPSVLYLSLHQFPFYPGTGSAAEIGCGDGQGYTVNVPLSAGCGDDDYAAAFERLVSPIVEQYAPDLLLVSAGYDAHVRDPLASMRLSAAAYGEMTDALLRSLPNRGAARFALVLEGGYDLIGLHSSLERTLQALDGEPTSSAGAAVPAVGELDLARARAALQPFWKFG
jgi:acetoin utilization deacetylase AcuC-like enzyme